MKIDSTYVEFRLGANHRIADASIFELPLMTITAVKFIALLTYRVFARSLLFICHMNSYIFTYNTYTTVLSMQGL